jgi:hypothetical protein
MDRTDLSTNSVNPEDQQLRRVLSTLIWASWGVYLFVIITALFYNDRVLFVATLAGCTSLGVPLVLIRRRRLHAASLVVLLIELVTVTIIATVGQGIRDLAMLAFPILLIFCRAGFGASLFQNIRRVDNPGGLLVGLWRSLWLVCHQALRGGRYQLVLSCWHDPHFIVGGTGSGSAGNQYAQGPGTGTR